MSNKYYKQVQQMSFQEMVKLLHSTPTTKADADRRCYAFGFLMTIANYVDHRHFDCMDKAVERIRKIE